MGTEATVTSTFKHLELKIEVRIVGWKTMVTTFAVLFFCKTEAHYLQCFLCNVDATQSEIPKIKF